MCVRVFLIVKILVETQPLFIFLFFLGGGGVCFAHVLGFLSMLFYVQKVLKDQF